LRLTYDSKSAQQLARDESRILHRQLGAGVLSREKAKGFNLGISQEHRQRGFTCIGSHAVSMTSSPFLA